MVPVPLEPFFLARAGAVRHVRLVAEIARQIAIERPDKRAADRRIRGIVIGAFAGGVGVDAGVARVVPADGLTLIAEQLLAEPRKVDAQVRPLNELGRQARQRAFSAMPRSWS